MTDFKTTLKSNIQSVELQKKKVKVTCANAKAGNLVITTLTQNISLLGGNNYDIDKGIDGAKDFHVKFKGKEEAQTFYDNLMNIVTDASVATVAPEKSGIQNLGEKVKNAAQKVGEQVKNIVEQRMGGGAPEEAPAIEAEVAEEVAPANPSEETMAGISSGNKEGSSKKKIMIIGGAVAIVLVLGIVLWKLKK